MNKIPVFFNNNMIVNVIFDTPSPRKPAEVVKEWLNKYEAELIDFEPVTLEDFYLVHDRKHVDGVISLKKTNGMGTKHQELVDSLYWTSGSMLAAARHALINQVAVSPTSGFHHAGHDYSHGFCTFNGLLLTAKKLLNEGFVNQVGILDFDYHYGDGSEDIIEKLNLNQSIVHITSEMHYERHLPNFFVQLPKMLEQLKNADMILYQAGADQ